MYLGSGCPINCSGGCPSCDDTNHHPDCVMAYAAPWRCTCPPGWVGPEFEQIERELVEVDDVL